ncbi:DUF441 domain-containing protein [Paenibacillus amylolyticus]|nr:DUF441 domain-containing protein [Paenibacillus amylolyticus]
MDMTSLLLLVFAALGIISSNTPVTVAMVFLLLLRVLNLNQAFPWLEKYGLTLGIIILTIGVMAPLASGKMSLQTIGESFLHWKSLLAIGVGLLVAYLGGRGATLMGTQPTVVAGLLIGTVLGVALFKGVPVGPLIAAGNFIIATGQILIQVVRVVT